MPQRTPPSSMDGGMLSSATNMKRPLVLPAAALSRFPASGDRAPCAFSSVKTTFVPTPKKSMSVPSDSQRQSGNDATRSVASLYFGSKIASKGVAA